LATLRFFGRDGAVRAESDTVASSETVRATLFPGESPGVIPRPDGFRASIAFVGSDLFVGQPNGEVWRVGTGRDRSVLFSALVVPAPRGGMSVARSVAADGVIVPVSLQQAYVRVASQVPLPPRAPSVRHMVSTPDGDLLTVESLPSIATTTIRRRDPKGALLAEYTFEGSLQIFEVFGDRLLGRTHREDGSQAVVVLRLPVEPTGRDVP
jgi:hypothetical protein